MTSRARAAFLVVLATSHGSIGMSAEQICGLTIYLVDSKGVSVTGDGFEAEFTRADESIRVSPFNGRHLTLPCGEYELWIRDAMTPGRSYYSELHLGVWRENQDRRISLGAGDFLHPSEPTGVVGSLAGSDRLDVWIRIMPLFYNMSPVQDQRISGGQGRFEFLGLKPGPHLIVVTDEGDVIATRLVQVAFSKTVDLGVIRLE